MKKIFCVTASSLFLLALSLTSCEEEKTPEELLIGKWSTESLHRTSYENGVQTDEENYTYEPGDEDVQFLEGGTGKVYANGAVEETFTWEISGDILKIKMPEDDAINMDFTVSETKLTLKYSFEETYEGVVYKEEMEVILSR